MLCDDWLARLNNATARRGASPQLIAFADKISASLGAAQRLVIAPDAQLMLAELVATTDRAAFEKARAFCVAPSNCTWIEWYCPARQTRVGFLLESETDNRVATSGTGYIVINAKTNTGGRDIVCLPIAWSVPGPEAALTIDPSWIEAPELREDFPGLLDEFGDDLVFFVVVAFALIASPRLIRTANADLARINTKRRRLGRPQLLEHSEISLVLDPDAEAAGDDAERADEPRSGRARHHVRAHYRFKRGKIEIVRHHMRGDKRLGTVTQRFTLRAKRP